MANFFATGGEGEEFGSLDDAGDATSLSNEISRVTGLRDDFDVREARRCRAWKRSFTSGYN